MYHRSNQADNHTEVVTGRRGTNPRITAAITHIVSNICLLFKSYIYIYIDVVLSNEFNENTFLCTEKNYKNRGIISICLRMHSEAQIVCHTYVRVFVVWFSV